MNDNYSVDIRWNLFREIKNIEYRAKEYLSCSTTEISFESFLDYCESCNCSPTTMINCWGTNGMVNAVKMILFNSSDKKKTLKINMENRFKPINFHRISQKPKQKPRKQIKGRVRQNVLMRDNYTCQICGATVKDGAKLELDHIIPISKGGSNGENNLQVLCQRCNREKHNRDDLLHDKLKLEELNGRFQGMA